ncbi:phosphomannomutase/phosphoglucomutase [Methanosphaerula palustris]|uniref:Phosphomannomutase n=1 Tax=Methanosphaerula palustris (strain ATCC BAA-1556 / DSM 19958 / E1-9c) TaxID=521011 RepID=B8GI17_METPE|nr:phosphomannomutase/phosphoglucomutase [Methanosphaerula palustris]ACL16757.1 Phosphomannomutase [Methanosphaerula palustris E1-9c]
MTGIFKAYDVRGSYPDELDETMAGKIGYAFARVLKNSRIVIGRDVRLSSPALARAFTGGYTAAGGAVTDIGMVSTPLLYYAIIEGEFDGGVMVTASHLPGEMNGFKLCRGNAVPLSSDTGLPELEQIARGLPPIPLVASSNSPENTGMTERYLAKLAGYVQGQRALTIVVDAGDGAAGPELSRLFDRVPAWNLIPLNREPDGRFPHHGANPFVGGAARELEERVPAERADMGVAFDGDADRCLFVDEQGRQVPPDIVTALIAEFFLAREPRARILYDLRSSRVVAETIQHLGGTAIRCRVGHAFIKAQMREERAPFAGELSGHYYFRDLGFIDCGLMAMIAMANVLSMNGKPLSSLVRPLLKYRSTGELNLQVEQKDAILDSLANKYRDAKIDRLDGLTVEYDTWWFNLRSSNTEPVIRLNLEAETESLLNQKKEEILGVILGADPSMHLKTE